MPAILGGSWPLCRRIHRIDGCRRLLPGINPRHYRDMIIRATQAGDMRRIDQLAMQLAKAEEARRLLQALTHCPACAANAVAGLVPDVITT